MNLDLANHYPALLGLLAALGTLFLVIRLAVSVSRPPALPLEVRGATLRIDGDKYGGPVPLAKLRLDEARVVDLEHETALQPETTFANSSPVRVNLPTRRSGWFTLKNGQRALVYLTPQLKALYIPTTGDYAVLISVDNPERFLASLRHG